MSATLAANIGREYTAQQARQLSPLQLAYIGDAVYDLTVRTRLLQSDGSLNGELHRKCVGKVCAPAQAEALARLDSLLTEEEGDIVRRGRNAKHAHVGKRTSRGEYGQATGLEALIGFLYLSGQDARLRELFDRILEDE